MNIFSSKWTNTSLKQTKKQRRKKIKATYLSSRKPYPIKISKQKFNRCDTMQIHKGFDGMVFQTNGEGESHKFKSAGWESKAFSSCLIWSKEYKYSLQYSALQYCVNSECLILPAASKTFPKYRSHFQCRHVFSR